MMAPSDPLRAPDDEARPEDNRHEATRLELDALRAMLAAKSTPTPPNPSDDDPPNPDAKDPG
jgi:hypothetical protein